MGEAERDNLGFEETRSPDAGVVPLYFQEREYKDDEHGHSSKSTTNDQVVPGLTPPNIPRASLRGQRYYIRNGVPPPPMYPRYSPGYHPYYPANGYCKGFDEYNPYQPYGGVHGGCHVGFSPYFRYNPMNAVRATTS